MRGQVVVVTGASSGIGAAGAVELTRLGATVVPVAHTGGLIDLDDLQLERRWTGMRAYSSSKLANVLFTRELARRLEGTGVVANCFHPGVIRTRLTRRANPLLNVGAPIAAPFLGSPKTGAETLVYLATAPEAADVTGGYFENSRPGRQSAQSQDDGLAAALWERSAQLVGQRASSA